jgi:hypothetical protein
MLLSSSVMLSCVMSSSTEDGVGLYRTSQSRIGSKRLAPSGACTGEQHRRGETEATEVMHDLDVTVL